EACRGLPQLGQGKVTNMATPEEVVAWGAFCGARTLYCTGSRWKYVAGRQQVARKNRKNRPWAEQLQTSPYQRGKHEAKTNKTTTQRKRDSHDPQPLLPQVPVLQPVRICSARVCSRPLHSCSSPGSGPGPPGRHPATYSPGPPAAGTAAPSRAAAPGTALA